MSNIPAPARETLSVHCHADQATVTIEGITLPAADAMPLLEQVLKRTPPPLLIFTRDEGAGYESMGKIVYLAGRAGFPDECFSLLRGSQSPALRPATEADIPFLMDLRHQCMDPVMLAAGMAPTDEAHMQRILVAFDSAQVVELAGEPVGLLKVVRTPPVWDLIQIQVSPAHQGKGLGEHLLRSLMAQAMAAGVSIKLCVIKINPALHLYERLGFVVIGETETNYSMLFTPA